MILLIDNYDSFTYNLVHYLAELGAETVVKRNDEISISEIEELNPQAIIISPGPCTPNEAGICLDLITAYKDKFPILGVCLGHQAIAQAFGAEIVKAPKPMHGKVDDIKHNGDDMFADIPSPFAATRYHSLIIKNDSLPDELLVTATNNDGDIIMAIRHKTLPIFGLQFHPESIATEHGHQLLRNFLNNINN
jgi:anthranilate synthase/aminodeoxychorismate synthase-like glutamine amidotransferase